MSVLTFFSSDPSVDCGKQFTLAFAHAAHIAGREVVIVDAKGDIEETGTFLETVTPVDASLVGQYADVLRTHRDLVIVNSPSLEQAIRLAEDQATLVGVTNGSPRGNHLLRAALWAARNRGADPGRLYYVLRHAPALGVDEADLIHGQFASFAKNLGVVSQYASMAEMDDLVEINVRRLMGVTG